MSERFDEAIKALDRVTAALTVARNDLPPISCYEADKAAFKLMQLVFVHVNAISTIAAIKYTGSHLAAAWVLVRAAFEAGVIAQWLAEDDDWREREARWLGWMTKDEEYWNRAAGDIRSINSEGADSLVAIAEKLARRRIAISEKLPKDSRPNRPSMDRLLWEVGMEKHYYVAYRQGSHVAHAGPWALEMVSKQVSETQFSLLDVVTVDRWRDPLRMASWSIAQPGIVVLARVGAERSRLDRLVETHTALIEATDNLKD